MGCISILLKIFLFCVNFLIIILGLLLVAVGSVLAYFRNEIGTDLGLIIAITLIVVGIVIFFIAFSGCCGVICGISCFLILYAIFITLVAGLNIYLIVVTFQNKDRAGDEVSNMFDDLFKEEDNRNFFYLIEYMLGCCGTSGAGAYVALELTIPPTCCPNADFPSLDSIQDIIDNIDGTEICPKEEAYDGCSPRLIDLFGIVFNVFAYFFIALLVLEVLAILSSIYLIRRIRRYRGKVY